MRRQIIRIFSIPSKNIFSQTRYVNVMFIDGATGEKGQEIVPIIPGPNQVSFSPYINWEGQVVPVGGILRRR